MEYEHEQDRHLRTLAKQTIAKERETLDAIGDLAECVRQRRVYMMASLVMTILAITMAFATLYYCYVIQ